MVDLVEEINQMVTVVMVVQVVEVMEVLDLKAVEQVTHLQLVPLKEKMGEVHQVVAHQIKEVVAEVQQQLALVEALVQGRVEQEQIHL